MTENLDQQIHAFLQGSAALLAQRTVQAYRADLQQWSLFFREQGIEQLASVNVRHLRHFLLRERQRGIGVRSLRRRFAALRAFYRWLRHSDPSMEDPSIGMPLPKLEQHFPDCLGVDQARELLEQARSQVDSFLALRNQAILELLYSSALRVSELAQLEQKDMDTRSGLVRVLGKGSKERIVPVGRYALAALTAYLPLRAQRVKDTNVLFISHRGTPLGVRGIQYLVDKAGRERLGQRLHPHTLRHSAASHLLQSSGDLRSLQEFLGHAQIDTTAIYTHLDFQHLAQVYDQSHPRARSPEKKT